MFCILLYQQRHMSGMFSQVSTYSRVLDTSSTTSNSVATTLQKLTETMKAFTAYTETVRFQQEEVRTNVVVFETVRVSIETYILNTIHLAPTEARGCLTNYLQLSQDLRLHVHESKLSCLNV
ncbi:hypothetical protein NEOLI_002998 [Neolecta irregularis DAH-3]|uniref:Uncharacterized protein n=1 Tax=Neolecta irregularis (strain DAH-3) TaxID=1198029 RepID=A0A1U7LNG0_NEOID|nr:hypothetical protein NEOLI_002998 [Neolecta irregularis DAH-3]|eukprot:OLL24187.1 hypothetical protein NEOLI_002998 [Neolecta irregularis DAH-3]